MTECIATSLRSLVDAGVASARKSLEHARIIRELEDMRKREIRIAETVAAIPRVVSRAFVDSNGAPTACPLMFLNADEYAGPVEYDPRSREGCPEPDPGKLKLSAALLFEQLQRAGFEPTLSYQYQYAADRAFYRSPIPDVLCISIMVQ